MIGAWLFGWLFWMGISLGSLWFMCIYHLTLGNWGRTFVPRAAAAARAVVVMIPLGIPFLLNLPAIYPWADPARVNADKVLSHRTPLFNLPMVQGRWVIYMLLWSVLAFAVSHMRGGQLLRRQGVAAGGMILHLALSTVMSVDLVMSLEPHFYSTVFALILIMAQSLSALALLVFFCLMQPEYRRDQPDEEDRQRSHDWGSLMLSNVMLLAYMYFSQLVVVWSGNLPHEIEWLQPRVWGPWMPLSAALFLGYLAFPFLVCLVGPLKRNPHRMRPVMGYVALTSPLMLYDLVWPSLSPKAMVFDPLALAALAIVGLCWGLTYRFFLGRALR
jgi:hypothetical protein